MRKIPRYIVKKIGVGRFKELTKVPLANKWHTINIISPGLYTKGFRVYEHSERNYVAYFVRNPKGKVRSAGEFIG